MDHVWNQIGQSGPLGIAMALCLGLGLAAATGLRAFLPLLIVAVLSRFHLLGVNFGEGFAFTGRANLREITDKPGVEFLFRKGAYVCF